MVGTTEELMKETIEMFGVPMHAWAMEETVGKIEYRLDAGLFTQHVVVNVAKLVNMGKNPELKEAVVDCDIINIDGMGVVWGARMLGYKIPERVAGIDLFSELLRMASRRDWPVFFLGAKQDIVEKAVENIRGDHPKLKIAGWHHGYFWDDEQAVVRQIKESEAMLLFVAITSPKKEQFIHRWRDELGVKFAMGVGGTFDIVAGKTQRAPQWMQKSGLEWLFRVIQEPRRMWKRYLVTNTMFILMLMRERFRRRTRGAF